MEGDKKCELPISWAELHHDLLRAIYKRLHDTFDFINFRAVCKWWREAAPLSEQPPQFPLLLESSQFPCGNSLSSEFELFSVHTGKTRKLQLPQAQNRTFYGQSQGYLVMYRKSDGDNDASPALLNPFTGAELSLPFGNCNFFMPIYIGADPMQNTRDVVIYMSEPHTGLWVGFWKGENNEWALKGGLPGSVQAYHKGRLFLFDSVKESTKAIHLTSGKLVLDVSIPTNRGGFCVLVEGAGELFGIEEFLGYELENFRFEVYRLDEEEKPPCWVKTTDIGDLMIFMNSDPPFCLSTASGFDGIRGNCIYFTRWNGKFGPDCRTRIGRYELGKNSSEVIGERRCWEPTWIVPNFY